MGDVRISHAERSRVAIAVFSAPGMSADVYARVMTGLLRLLRRTRIFG